MNPHQIMITSDSACDLAPAFIEQNNIALIPHYVSLSGRSYRDMKDITPNDIFAHYTKTGEIAKTAAVSTDEYVRFFRENMQSGREIIHLNVSGGVSSSYLNACAATWEVPGVHVVDTHTVTCGIGFMAVMAKEMAEQGHCADEIAKRLVHERERISGGFVVDTLEYLRKGGRCSAIAALGANLLKIKPCIHITGGRLKPAKYYRGPIERVIPKFLSDELMSLGAYDRRQAFLVHTGCSDEILQDAGKLIASIGGFDEIHTAQVGTAITCHVGPNALGLFVLKTNA